MAIAKKTKIILLVATAVVALVGGYFIYRQVKFGRWRKDGRNIVFVTKSSSGEIVISNFDSVWDYKYVKSAASGSQWYTRRKGSTAWINMKSSLSLSNYNLSVSRLLAFLK